MGNFYSQLTNNEPNGEREVNINDGILKPMKKYFAWTGQSCSFPNSSQKRILYTLFQFVIASLAASCFLYTSCLFPTNKTLYHISRYFIYYPITTIDQAAWNLRWLLTCWLGIWLTSRGIWQNIFDKSMTLGENRLKKVKTFSWRLGAALILMVFIQEFGIFLELDFKITGSLALAISLDALFMLLDRTLAFPLFFLLCITMYILCGIVEEYGEKIKQFPGNYKEAEKKEKTDDKGENAALDDKKSMKDKAGEENLAVHTGTDNDQDENKDKHAKDEDEGGKSEIADATKKHDPQEQVQHNESESGGENLAREEFRKIKGAIRNAGEWFELYLMFHFLLLLCTFFLGVFACFEQIEVRISENYTMALPFGIPREARFVNFFGNLTLDSRFTIASPAAQPASTLTASSYAMSFTLTDDGRTAGSADGNNSLDHLNDLIRTELLKKSLQSFAFCTFSRTLESLFLYFVPIYFMVRLQNSLRRVYEVIEDSNVEKQKKKNYLFKDVEVIRRMCKYVKTAHSLRIFGHTVPTFEAFMLAAFTPFATLMLQRLMVSIHMKQG